MQIDVQREPKRGQFNFFGRQISFTPVFIIIGLARAEITAARMKENVNKRRLKRVAVNRLAGGGKKVDEGILVERNWLIRRDD